MTAREGSFLEAIRRQSQGDRDADAHQAEAVPERAWARAINNHADIQPAASHADTEPGREPPPGRDPGARHRGSLFDGRHDDEGPPIGGGERRARGEPEATAQPRSSIARYGESIDLVSREIIAARELSVLNAPQSDAAKAYLGLYSQIASNGIPASGIPAIAITSFEAQTGRTATAANLAVLFARSGMQVVLIEADFKRPKLLSMFGVPSMSGLGDWVCGRDRLSGAVFDALPNLTLIPAGQGGDGLEEKLAHPGFRRWLQRLASGKNTVLLIDTAPRLAAVETESICVNAGHAILTCRRHGTRVAASSAYVRRLRDRGVTFLGASLLD
ncbi:CpsD/CapB family tyrosine-protein kinase [bacterium]|nr:CpsD/CapB family tyrosine-protein kinase [bacterium]